jgi:hypothetical protein
VSSDYIIDNHLLFIAAIHLLTFHKGLLCRISINRERLPIYLDFMKRSIQNCYKRKVSYPSLPGIPQERSPILSVFLRRMPPLFVSFMIGPMRKAPSDVSRSFCRMVGGKIPELPKLPLSPPGKKSSQHTPRSKKNWLRLSRKTIFYRSIFENKRTGP